MHELLPCDWPISNLCYQAIEQVYLIKWPVTFDKFCLSFINYIKFCKLCFGSDFRTRSTDFGQSSGQNFISP